MEYNIFRSKLSAGGFKKRFNLDICIVKMLCIHEKCIMSYSCMHISLGVFIIRDTTITKLRSMFTIVV